MIGILVKLKCMDMVEPVTRSLTQQRRPKPLSMDKTVGATQIIPVVASQVTSTHWIQHRVIAHATVMKLLNIAVTTHTNIRRNTHQDTAAVLIPAAVGSIQALQHQAVPLPKALRRIMFTQMDVVGIMDRTILWPV